MHQSCMPSIYRSSFLVIVHRSFFVNFTLFFQSSDISVKQCMTYLILCTLNLILLRVKCIAYLTSIFYAYAVTQMTILRLISMKSCFLHIYFLPYMGLMGNSTILISLEFRIQQYQICACSNFVQVFWTSTQLKLKNSK